MIDYQFQYALMACNLLRKNRIFGGLPEDSCILFNDGIPLMRDKAHAFIGLTSSSKCRVSTPRLFGVTGEGKMDEAWHAARLFQNIAYRSSGIRINDSEYISRLHIEPYTALRSAIIGAALSALIRFIPITERFKNEVNADIYSKKTDYINFALTQIPDIIEISNEIQILLAQNGDTVAAYRESPAFYRYDDYIIGQAYSILRRTIDDFRMKRMRVEELRESYIKRKNERNIDVIMGRERLIIPHIDEGDCVLREVL